MKEISEEEYIERTDPYGGKIFRYLRQMEVGKAIIVDFKEWKHRTDLTTRVGWYNRKNGVYYKVDRDKNNRCWVIKRIK